MSTTPPAYGPSDSGVTTFALTMLVFGIAGGVAYWLASRSMSSGLAELIGFGVVLVGFTFAMVRGLGLTERRQRATINSLIREGLQVNTSPTWDSTLKLDELLPHASKWLDLLEGRPGVRWVATCPDGRTQLFEHVVVVGSGDENAVTFKSVVLREGMPDNLFVAFERADGRRREEWMKQNAGRLFTGDKAFDELWMVSGDRKSARLVLTPQVRAALEGAPPGEAWVLGNGILLLNFQNHTDARGFATMRVRVDAVAKLIERLSPLTASSSPSESTDE